MSKKLQRDTNNKVIGGVCSGLAKYFEIDAALVRLLFAVAFFAFSTGFWLYVILWIIMPGADLSQGANATENDNVADHLADSNPKTENKGALIAGLALIFLGVMGLVHHFVPQINWRIMWPILLIVLGLFLIVPIKNSKS